MSPIAKPGSDATPAGPRIALAAAGVVVILAVLFATLMLTGPRDGDDGAGGGGGKGAGGGDGANRDPKGAIDIIPAAKREMLSPVLVDFSAWPADGALASLGNVPADARPDPRAVEKLVADVSRLVGPSLGAKAEAACRDDKGRLFLRLGTDDGRVYAQAVATSEPEEALAMRFSFRDDDAPDKDRLLARLRSVASETLGEAMASEKTDRGEHPTVHGPDGYQATYVLDGGIAQVYPFAMIYATPRDIVLVVQPTAPNHEHPKRD